MNINQTRLCRALFVSAYHSFPYVLWMAEMFGKQQKNTCVELKSLTNATSE